jgi:hypothetical protein
MVKIFTMVKGEDDIVHDWVIYHGNIFGFKNLHVIDNYSRDNTYPILLDLKNKYGIHVYRLDDYKKKGIYMTALFKRFCRNEFGIPLDIDEFIVYYNKDTNSISCSPIDIRYILSNLPKTSVYKMDYIQSKLSNKDGYKRSALECEWGTYTPYHIMGKSFFHSSLFRGVIDHGNHYKTHEYLLTPLCLVHFHARNIDQFKKKVFNNVKGLGYNPFDLQGLQNIAHNPNTMGIHHIHKQISMLTNQFEMPYEEHTNNDISLKPLNDFFIDK